MKYVVRVAAGLFAAAIVVGLALGAHRGRVARDILHAGGPICPFRVLAGFPCPFCGMTQATFAFAGGDLDRAFALHPMFPLVLAGALAVALSIAFGRDRWLRSHEAPSLVVGAIAIIWIAKLAAS